MFVCVDVVVLIGVVLSQRCSDLYKCLGDNLRHKIKAAIEKSLQSLLFCSLYGTMLLHFECLCNETEKKKTIRLFDCLLW